MEIDEALGVIKALADGVDPNTGEMLPDNSPIQSAIVVRALYTSINALEKNLKSTSRKSNLPDNAGKPWSDEEDKQVEDEYKSGMTVTEISKLHLRTRGAIQSRLLKLGLIVVPPDFEDSEDLKKTLQSEAQPPLTDDENISSDARECLDCGVVIPVARVQAIPNVIRCAHCQEKLEAGHPELSERKVDEGLAGSREDNKKMRNKNFSDIRKRNYE